jgi:hypothetical protein
MRRSYPTLACALFTDAAPPCSSPFFGAPAVTGTWGRSICALCAASAGVIGS